MSLEESLQEYNMRKEDLEKQKVICQHYEAMCSMSIQDISKTLKKWEKSSDYDILTREEIFFDISRELKKLESEEIGTISFYVFLHDSIIELKEKLKKKEKILYQMKPNREGH